MRTLLPEQREALIDALIEDWHEVEFDDLMEYVDAWLINGRRGYVDYDDDELVSAAEKVDLHYRLAELGINTED